MLEDWEPPGNPLVVPTHSKTHCVQLLTFGVVIAKAVRNINVKLTYQVFFSVKF